MKNLVIAFALLFLVVPCQAETIIVNPNGSADFNNIQDAINYSRDGDTIFVSQGHYYENIDFRGKAITVRSIDPNDPNVIENTVIDANGDEIDDIVVSFHMGEGVNSVISGFTITGGHALYGAGICCWENCSPTISNCIITENDASDIPRSKGAGIWASNCTISKCIISRNSADYYGGGICSENHVPLIIGCSISGNYARLDGGGVYCSEGDTTITDCTISSNSAGSHGGGIYCESSVPTVINCNISSNSSGYQGGGIHCYSYGNAIITDCIISGNSANGEGGGINCNGISSPTISRCNIIGNLAGSHGGGVNCYRSDPTISRCTIAGNLSGNNGGGVNCNEASSPNINNCTINGNLATDRGGGLYSGTNCSPLITNNIICNSISGCGIYYIFGTPTISYNDVYGNADVDYDGWAWPGEGDISVDPCFVDSGHWEDPCNTPGDYSDDIWIDGDYHLKSEIGRWDPNSEIWVIDDATSLCIDSGDPNSDWTAELWPHGKRINMGAYGGTSEASMSLSYLGNIADLNNDSTVDSADLEIFVVKWLFNEILLAEDFDRNRIVDFKDYAIFADNWLWQE
jgi:predicted outer membrane repeat protein